MPRALKNNAWLLNIFVGREAFHPVCKGPTLGISDELYFFALLTRIFHVVKSVVPFSKLIIGKSQVFSARSYVHFHGYRQIRDGGWGAPALVLMGFSRILGWSTCQSVSQSLKVIGRWWIGLRRHPDDLQWPTQIEKGGMERWGGRCHQDFLI